VTWLVDDAARVTGLDRFEVIFYMATRTDQGSEPTHRDLVDTIIAMCPDVDPIDQAHRMVRQLLTDDRPPPEHHCLEQGLVVLSEVRRRWGGATD
jgi:hypothetical protein